MILCNFGILGISLLSDVQLWTLNIHVAAMKKTSMNRDRRMLRETWTARILHSESCISGIIINIIHNINIDINNYGSCKNEI